MGRCSFKNKGRFLYSLFSSIRRLGVTYYLNDVTKLTSGYAYVSNYPGDNHENITQPERRAWQQIQWHNKYAKIRTMQWFRLEEKFKRKILNDSELASGYTFNYKMRYNFYMQAPLSKKGIQPRTFSFVVNDEVHINLESRSYTIILIKTGFSWALLFKLPKQIIYNLVI